MKVLSVAAFFLVVAALAAPPQTREDSHLGAVYFWKAKPGKLEEYNKYIREFAEPIDEEARRGGALPPVPTYASHRPDAPPAHTRVFLFRDPAHPPWFSAALAAAEAE